MVTTEHRKPLVAFLVVFAAACLVMGNGLRTQVVEVLIETGGSNELVTAIAPDMVLGQALDGAPQPQAAAKKVPAVQGPVQAGADDAGRHRIARPPHSPWPTRPRSGRLPVRTRALSTQGRLRIAVRKHGPAVPRDPQPGLLAASPQPRSPVPERLPGPLPVRRLLRSQPALGRLRRPHPVVRARQSKVPPTRRPAASILERRQGTCAGCPGAPGQEQACNPTVSALDQVEPRPQPPSPRLAARQLPPRFGRPPQAGRPRAPRSPPLRVTASEEAPRAPRPRGSRRPRPGPGPENH